MVHNACHRPEEKGSVEQRAVNQRKHKRQHDKAKRNNAPTQACAAAYLADLQEQVSALTRERAEAREQQTATSEVLRVISGSPGELQPVFGALLNNAIRLCGAKFGMLYLCEGDALRIMAAHNLPPAFAEVPRRVDSVLSRVAQLAKRSEPRGPPTQSISLRPAPTPSAIRRASPWSSSAALAPPLKCRC